MGCKWKNCKLGDVITFQRGKDLPRSKMIDGPFPVIGSNGIIGWHNEYTSSGPVITVGRSGNTGRPFMYKGAAWAHNTTLYVKEFKEAIPEYIYYFLQTLNLSSHAGGSAVPTLNRNHVHTLDISVPDLDTQARIATTLAAIDTEIKLNNQINDYLADLGETIASKACRATDGVLGDICCQVSDKEASENASIETYISTESLLQNKGGRQIASSMPASGKVTRYRKGDTLVSNVRPYFKKICYASEGGTCSGDVLVFRANDASYAPYLYFCLHQDSFFNHMMQGAKGTKMPRGDKKQIMEYAITKSCDEESLRILNAATDLIAKNSSESNYLAELRDALLPKLISGEIDVSKVNITQLNNHLSDC